MTRETIRVTVEVSNADTQGAAIAEASAYLAYADQTDTFAPQRTTINAATVSNTPPSEGEIVILDVSVHIPHTAERHRLAKELDTLTKVLNHDLNHDVSPDTAISSPPGLIEGGNVVTKKESESE